MPNELNEFYDAIRYYDVDDAVTDDSKVQGYLDSVRKFGQNLLDDFRDLCSGNSKLRPPKPNALVRTISEAAFLEPKDVTPLDDVTKPALIEYTTKSNILRNTSYSVRDLSVLATYEDKNRNQEFGLRVGDKLGVNYTKEDNFVSYNASLEHNIYNDRTTLEYTVSRPLMTYSASVYHKDGKVGAALSYSNKNGFGSCFSYDGKDCAVSVGYSHKFSDCNVSIKGFISSYKQELDDFRGNLYNKNNQVLVGVTGNITM